MTNNINDKACSVDSNKNMVDIEKVDTSRVRHYKENENEAETDNEYNNGIISDKLSRSNNNNVEDACNKPITTTRPERNNLTHAE